ncbi:mediator of RNA polymerase II transcription subunit 12 isoform X2 [Magnolia sinica]|uniref:mediator of RNA polymerase II transcription subunit 12 isoform X2 n=1 Tax=Magnolia sinica TaxID=86752 RepID=UPI0026599226|nr:mediator of RNA polymerase II transcription subunit 12 isoform X2 [Magnolia sinica]
MVEMQRYPVASCSGGVSNNAVGGTSSRDTSRADSSFSSSNFALNSRRQSQLTSYKLKCDKEPLSSRLGPPDFYPQTPNCSEETLTKEYVQVGYRETVDGIAESRETELTQTTGSLTKPLIGKCKEAIRKRLRAINDSRAQKRKAGQVYGAPLSGPLLTKPGVFPEQRPCGEDFRKKWIEGLSQQHKRLRSLADHVPHGYRRKSLFEVLIRHNVPLLRATWFIKVTYLNQVGDILKPHKVRPASTSVSSGTPDKLQLARTELWTKDVIDYLQHLLDEFLSKDGSLSIPHSRDQTPQTLLAGNEEPALQFKWWYMVRILQWHHAEGLLPSSHIIEWVLNQLQEKESLGALQLLLPIVFDVIEHILLSQTYVRMLVDIAVRSIQDLSRVSSDVDNSRRPYIASALVEILRYLILAVPDTFVALDCFPLPPCVVPDAMNGRQFLLTDVEKVQYGPRELVNLYNGKGQDAYHRYLSFGYVVSSVQKRTANLAMAVTPGLQGHGVTKAVQALDKSLILGDVRGAYNCLFENFCDGSVEEGWVAEVSPCLRSSLKWIGAVSLPVICSVFLLCEWATCDFRNCRTALPHDLKFTGRKDFCQVYIAVQLLKMRMEDMHGSSKGKKGSPLVANALAKGFSLHDSFSGAVDDVSVLGDSLKSLDESEETLDILQSPGPLHDIVVCWLDQHEASKGEGFKRLQMLVMELIRFGIFYPQAYVRQLIVSGIMDRNESTMEMDRRNRHHRILKHLPGPCLHDALKEARIAETTLLVEAMRVYSNERRLVLHGLLSQNSGHLKTVNGSVLNFSMQKPKDNSTAGRDGALHTSLNHLKNNCVACSPLSTKQAKTVTRVAELKAAISVLLHLPNSGSTLTETQSDESQGSLKRPIGSLVSRTDLTEGTPGCEECKRSKRQKSSEERNSHLLGFSSNASDDEDMWWVRKGPKPLESFKVDPPLRATKQSSRGRQKIVRKTQSLAQLAAARIEGSQGASTSHVCDSKVNCPHHGTGMEGEIPKSVDGIRASHLSDIVTIGKALKQLRLLEKRSVTLWLITSIRQIVEGNEKAAAMAGQCTGPFSPPKDDRSVVRWKLGEDELSCILYLLDVSSDLFSAVKFLLWLLPRARSGSSSTIHSGRNILVLPKNTESHACELGEAFLLSSIRRYENVLIAMDLLPEALAAAMLRSMAVMTSNGRASGSVAFVYAKHLLKKFGSIASVAKWEKSFKATCDQRLLSELETARPLDSELGYSLVGVPVAMEDVDDYLRQKISGRLLRPAGPTMKEIVQRHIEEAMRYFHGKERKPFATTTPRVSAVEKWDDGFQIAQQIVLGLVDCIRQNGGSAQEVDPSVVGSAVSAIVSNVVPAISKMPDFLAGSNYPSLSSTTNSLIFARRIIHIHITCLCLLKEALGERQSRVFEIALATEASSAVSAAVASAKAPRSQFQLSPETHDSNSNMSNEILNNSAKVFLGRAAKAAAAVSALVIGAVVHGVATLERMVTVFRLKEGLDILPFVRTARSGSNGISRSVGGYKVDNSTEVSAHWFRLLIGNCRTVCDGLVVELLGESYALAVSRMQQTLPLNLVFPPAYSIFAMVIWRPYIVNSNIAAREDIQMYQSLSSSIGDAIRHQPFRDVCLRDTCALYDLLASDTGDSEFAAMLELHSPDKHLKTMAFVPLRARLFLNAILDCKMPQSLQDNGTWAPGHGESKAYAENEMKLLDQLVHVLDTLQPAKFHWQWVELRLLLNEQVLIEKVESQNMSLVEAIRSLSPNSDNFVLADNESNFTEIVLTRLLVRPDAARLYSEVVHQLGRSFEESLLLHAKWFLGGSDLLLGRKSIRQRLLNVAQLRGLSTKPQFSKPWGWSSCIADQAGNRGVKRKMEAASLEEGEVVEEGMDVKRSGKVMSQMADEQYVTEKALAELVFPCIDRSSNESRNTFANDLIKQMSLIEQQVNTVIRGANKQAGSVPSVGEGAANKGNTRKGMRGGSPGLGRRPTTPADSSPPSAAALRASMWLRLQFLLRLLPIICADREPSGRNMRHMLASILLRLLGTRVVHEDADLPCFPVQRISPSKREVELPSASFDLSGDSLFDRFLCVLHGLLSSCKPSWLKPKSASKSTGKSSRDFGMFDREVAESLQADLDRMQLPAIIRRRLQSAMPVLPASALPTISCQPPTVSTTAVSSLQSNISGPGFQQGNTNLPQRSPIPSGRATTNVSMKSKPLPLQVQDPDMEIDPWMLLEDGTGSAPPSGNSNMGVGDHTNLTACSWLKGTVRVRRTDLTYIGPVDDDS